LASSQTLLDLISSLTIFFVLSDSSDGTLLLFQLQLRPWRAIPQGRLAIPTPPAHAIPIVTPVDSRRNGTQPGTSWRLARIAELERQHQRKQLIETIDGRFSNLLNFILILN
jgi:hypothetical protein